MRVVIGCDVGTQSTKAVAVDDTGRVLSTASVATEVDVPAPAWAEQDPRTWATAIEDILAAIASDLGLDATNVSHVAIDAQVDGAVAADADLAPLAPAPIWMDRRATAQVQRLIEAVPAARIRERTGLAVDAAHSAPKMMWLADQVGDRVRWLLTPTAFCVAHLTGRVVHDHANASSTLLYDVHDRDYADELVTAAGFHRDALPPIAAATDLAGTLRPDVADRTGLPRDCQVLVGTGDDHAAAVGAGAIAPGIVADIAGTAEPVGTTTDAPVVDAQGLLETHAHAVPDAWFLENPGFVSGGSTAWIARVIGVNQEEVFELAGKAEPASQGLIFIPALSGSMAPRWNAAARGSFTGAALGHSASDLCRAVLEGCVFALRDNVDRLRDLGLPVDEIRVTGGGARSDLWLAIKADVLGVPVTAAHGEGAALGSACLAAVAAGWFDDLSAATEALLPPTDPPVEPDADNAEVYEHAYRTYRATFDALEPTFGPS